MDRKPSDRRIVMALIVALVVEIAMLAVHLSWGGFRFHAEKREAQIAGRVLKNENELRRRGNNSLVWEKSASDDAVYFYDSILTLAQSTASLKLYQDTEVKLSENTLVTIEPQENKGSGEIRLKFVKGSLKARNPFAATKLETDTWSMEIKSGSDIDFRQVGEGNFELEVNKGEVEFNSGVGGSAKVSSAEMLRIRNDTPEKIRIDEAFRWIEPPPARIYTHAASERVKLRWQAAGAHELVVQTQSDKEMVIPVREGADGEDLNLGLGRHQIFLRADGKTSQALSVEVWRAPLLHLVSPLPRNRVRTATPTAFLWMITPGVASYNFIFRGKAMQMREPATENAFTASFPQEDDAEWSVEGQDPEGFAIPPLYTYPIYIREAPLAAPKLGAPVLRRPAKVPDGGAAHWLLQSFLPEAAADEILYQALFNWEKVDGADRYVIEISETADFRNPLVNKTVLKNEFMWKKMELKSYYWRVAAETKTGRLGIFSDPALVDLKNGGLGVAVKPLENPHPEPPPLKEKKPLIQLGSGPAPSEPFSGEPGDDTATIEKAPEPVDLAQAPAPPPIEKFEIRPHAFVEWRPGYTLLAAKAADNVSADLAGGNALSFAVGADRNYSPEEMVRLQFNYVRQKFKPQPQEKYPGQDDLTWSELSFAAVLHKSSSHLGYGIFVEHGAAVERKDLESVQTRATNIFGPCFQGYFQWGRVVYVSDYIAVIGTDYGILTRQNVQVHVGGGQFYVGGGLEGSALFKSAARTSAFTGQLTLGFDF